MLTVIRKKKQMHDKPITTFKLAYNNIKRRPLRTFGLTLIVGITAFVLFAGGIVSASMKNGLASMSSRLGADLMIVPVGYDEGVEGILLKGEPTYFYLERNLENSLKEVEGVKTVSSQFFLTSLNQDCCAIPVQFIGFDPDTDFSIQPWIKESFSGEIKDGELIVGHDIAADENNQLKFFNEKFDVAAKLDETGTGLDQAVYANMNTLMHLFDAAKRSGLAFIDDIDPYSSVSSILVKVEDGYSLEEVTHNIRASMDGVQVIKTKTMITGIADNLSGLVSYIYILAGLFVGVTFITLVIIFSVIANERKKEFAILCTLGATGKMLSGLVLSEAFLICAIGGGIGIASSGLVVFLFRTLIGDKIGLPYLQPDIGILLIVTLITVIISLGLGPFATAGTAFRLSRREVYLTLREGE
jgi:putative ABC transport system permease protein